MKTTFVIQQAALSRLINVLLVTAESKKPENAGIYLYSLKAEYSPDNLTSKKKDDDDDSYVGEVPLIAGLSCTADLSVAGHYFVPMEHGELDPLYLSTSQAEMLNSFISVLNANHAKNRSEEDDQDTDCAILIVRDQSPDEDVLQVMAYEDRNDDSSSFLTLSGSDYSDYPDEKLSRIISGEGLDQGMSWTDLDEEVPNGPVTVWESGPHNPLSIIMRVSKMIDSEKLFAVQKHHSTRMHRVQIGNNWTGIVTPNGGFSHSGAYDPEEIISETHLPSEVFDLEGEDEEADDENEYDESAEVDSGDSTDYPDEDTTDQDDEDQTQ